jgi:tRNA-specific 2-thiouridylase
MSPNGKKVLVAMSGGVDSGVAACLLKEQGYDVVGVFMRLGADRYQTAPAETVAASPDTAASVSLPIARHLGATDSRHSNKPSKGCCSAADATDARQVAGNLGIPFYALNFERDFDQLIDYFVDEYANARTPNPCIRCNQWLKFGRLVAYADLIGADLIATGHYAQTDHVDGRTRLRRARDAEKDQSYVLFGIEPQVLRRTLFPLGEMTKEQVRAHARRLGLSIHDKPESQDICFVPDGDYARLVRSRRPDGFQPGDVKHVDGRLLGRHEGLANFTIGQRRGLRVPVGSPVYVTQLDPSSATVVVGPRDAVMSPTARAERVRWLCAPPDGSVRLDVKIRYHHDPAPAKVVPLGGDAVSIEFDAPQSAVTPGQAAVFYQADEVLGGGWIIGP